MRTTCLNLFAIALSLNASAVELEFVDGDSVGVEAALRQHVAGYAAEVNGASAWLWGALGWSDASGNYLYAGFHNANRFSGNSGYIFRQGADGQYVDVTPDPVNGFTAPAGSKPILLDVDGNGLLDLVNADDECSNCTTLLNTASGWVHAPQYTLRFGSGSRVVDIDGDGRLDIDAQSRHVFNRPSGFEVVDIPLATRLAPIGNAGVIARAEASQEAGDRFVSIRLYEAGGDFFVTYKGSYAQGVQQWTMIVRDGVVVEDFPGFVTEPVLVDGDPLVILSDGEFAPVNGFYRRQADGSYAKAQVPDGRREVGFWIGKGAYPWIVTSVDLDGDGDDDLVVDGQRWPEGYVLEQENGAFTTVVTMRTADGHSMWVGDIDGDGDADIVHTNQGDLSVAPATNNRNSTDFGIWLNQSNVAPPPEPAPIPEPVGTVAEAIEDAADAISQAQICAAQMDTACTQAAIDAAQSALLEGEQRLPFP